jgi:putative phage-type endonuclease
MAPFVSTKPKDKQHWLEMRAKDLTSTDIPALFGLSPYLTEFELWHQKRNRVVEDFQGTERMEVGRVLEDAIASLVVDRYFQNGSSKKIEDYYSQPHLRLGASFDHMLTFNDDTPCAILEIKNVDRLVYKQHWAEDEAPPHIELQVQHQMLVAHIRHAYIAVLVGGNELPRPLFRECNQGICDQILGRASMFWESVDNGIEPDVDWGKDTKFISQLYGFAEPGKVIDASPAVTNHVQSYQKYSAAIGKLEKRRSEAKGNILRSIGDAEKVIGDGFSITAGMVGPKEIAYTSKGYRQFKINRRAKK